MSRNVRKVYENTKLIAEHRISDTNVLDEIAAYLADGYNVTSEYITDGFKIEVGVALGDWIEYSLHVD